MWSRIKNLFSSITTIKKALGHIWSGITMLRDWWRKNEIEKEEEKTKQEKKAEDKEQKEIDKDLEESRKRIEDLKEKKDRGLTEKEQMEKEELKDYFDNLTGHR